MQPLIKASEVRGQAKGRVEERVKAQAEFEEWKEAQRRKGVNFVDEDE